ncbi:MULTISPECIES: hypothetical protein [Paenibacillus]|uniref:Uncharacterized protein n=1 Tax=Paenibacillus odorifer TaxID=189426 RepID=A0AB36JCR3_9BACL|nr:hypothetical protein [Paenibacillus odorifer]OME16426.1 hypothetical protein BSK60_08860 [Paenibacillus odorifer]OME19523.1 hypothetical protein BSK47_15925 [Paenibacillus odorifer]
MKEDLQTAYEALSRVTVTALATGDKIALREAGLARAKTLELKTMLQQREVKPLRVTLNRVENYCLPSL